MKEFKPWFANYAARLGLSDLAVHFLRPHMEAAWTYHQESPDTPFAHWFRLRYGPQVQQRAIIFSRDLLQDAYSAATDKQGRKQPRYDGGHRKPVLRVVL